MRLKIILLMLALALVPAVATAQATRPAAPLGADYELRAMQAFANREWRTALPMLKRVVEASADRPDKVRSLEEYVRVCERNIADPAAAAAFDPKTMLAAPGDPPTAPDKRAPHAPPKPGETRTLDIKQLGNFEYDADRGGNIPADVLALDGATVRIGGYMIPLTQTERISEFALVPSLLACCFGSPPQVQHTVIVRAPAGKAVGYFPDEIACEGKLTVREKKDDEFIVSLFELDVTSVKPAVR